MKIPVKKSLQKKKTAKTKYVPTNVHSLWALGKKLIGVINFHQGLVVSINDAYLKTYLQATY